MSRRKMVFTVAMFVLAWRLVRLSSLAADGKPNDPPKSAAKSPADAASDPAGFLEVARRELKWDEPAEPGKIAGPIYFIGTKGLGSYLITGTEGHIVLYTGMPGSGEMIEKSIMKLGYNLKDVKLLLTGHAHCDHVGGHAHLKKVTGAKVAMMREEAALLESGGKSDFHYGKVKEFAFDAAKVDRLLRDEEEIQLGNLKIQAFLTPGHTRGSATYVLKFTEEGRSYTVVFPDGTNVNPGYRVVRQPSYEGIEADFRKTFRTLESLKPDLWLAPHNQPCNLEAKRERALKEGLQAFIDPEGYAKFVALQKSRFEAAVEREKASAEAGKN